MTYTISLLASSPVLLIDTSYYIFHRYFATLRWYSFKPEAAAFEAEHGVGSFCDDTLFIQAYFKHFHQDLKKYLKTFKVSPENTLVFLKDCPHSTIWRHRFHTTYKEGRKINEKMDTRIFQRTYEWILQGSLPYPSVILSVPELEADDLAYLVTRAIHREDPEHPIVILTNDQDYIQLIGKYCRCFNASLKNIADRCQYGGADAPMTEMLAKILLGDRSDCIPACVAGRRAQTLLRCDECQLKDTMNPEEYVRYQHNKRLIDLSQIPEELQVRFTEIYRFQIVKADAA